MDRLIKGQSTVEFVAVFPITVIVAVIAVNALTFLGDCAAFDACARQTIRSVAASPGYGQSVSMSAARIEEMISLSFERDNIDVSVMVRGESDGLVCFNASMDYAPTLFGMGLKQEILGVPLPHLSHSAELTVEPYRPGLLQ